MILQYNMRRAQEMGANDHPQETMKLLNITYDNCEPYSVFDTWVFWGCIFDIHGTPLPKYLSVIPNDFKPSIEP